MPWYKRAEQTFTSQYGVLSFQQKKKNNYSSSDIGRSITNIQTEEIGQAKLVHEYRILHQTLARKCNNISENVA